MKETLFTRSKVIPAALLAGTALLSAIGIANAADDDRGREDTGSVQIVTGDTDIAPGAGSGQQQETFAQTADKSAVSLQPGDYLQETHYKVPAHNVIYMSPTGSDNAPGSRQQPVKHLQTAINRVPVNGTIVLEKGRNGEAALFRDGYARTDKTFTLQPDYDSKTGKNIAAWFDGTQQQSAARWQQDKNGNYFTTWSTPEFCDGKYYTSSLTGCAHPDMVTVTKPENRAYKMASDPMMVYSQGKELHQTPTYGELKSGDFYHDKKNHLIYVKGSRGGNKNKALKNIEITRYASMLILAGKGQTIQGIGIRRYASNEQDASLMQAPLSAEGPDVKLRYITASYNASLGLFANGRGLFADHIIAARNGYNGMNINGHTGRETKPDNATVINSTFSFNNTKHYGVECNASCGQAGVKYAHLNGFRIENNSFDQNYGWGLWGDNYNRDGRIIGNRMRYNQRGQTLNEISYRIWTVNNFMEGDADKVFWDCSSEDYSANNTLISRTVKVGTFAVRIYEDPRLPNLDGKRPGQIIGPNTRGMSFDNNLISTRTGALSIEGVAMNGGNNQPTAFFDSFDNTVISLPSTGKNSPKAVQYRSATRKEYMSVSSFHTLPLVYGKPAGRHDKVYDIGQSPFRDVKKGDYRPAKNLRKAGRKLPADVAKAGHLSRSQPGIGSPKSNWR